MTRPRQPGRTDGPGRRPAALLVALIALAGSLSLVASGCGLQSANGYIPAAGPGTVRHYDSLSGVHITVGGKDFTEQLILANMAAILLKVAGADVTNQAGIAGSVAARQAQLRGDVQVELEYTGTAWIDYLGHAKPIKGRIPQWRAVRNEDARKNNLAWLRPAPMNNTYAFATPDEVARRLGVSKLSDLARLAPSQRTFCVESEFANRTDGFRPMLKAYGLHKIGKVSILDTGIIYTATDQGDCNFGEVFTTDGRIKALGLTVLKDDRHYFPLYNVAPVINESLLKQHPELRQIFAPVMRKITTATMLRLNAEVDIAGHDPALVARDWLRQEGFVS
ncbi:MAG: glycine betaine ABC transporter substrate-binding protein [Nocardioidaceae bacterium]